MISSPIKKRQELLNKEANPEEEIAIDVPVHPPIKVTQECLLSLQSIGRGYIIRGKYTAQIRKVKKMNHENKTHTESLKPENRYKVITTNLNELFKDSLTRKIDKLYGKPDLSEPLYDGVRIEEKPAFILDDGHIYKGEWSDAGKKHGRGREVHSDNTKYIGYFKEGHMDGWGRLLYPNGDMYEGYLKKGKLHGEGILRSDNGDLYDGQFRYNLKKGTGKEMLVSGIEYEGEYLDNKRCGQGKLKLTNGDTYEGEFKNGMMDGKGTLKSHRGFTYVGEFKEGKMHGSGVYSAKEGIYEGMFANDLKNGFGKFQYSDLRVYEGNWKDGHQHGEGCFGLEKERRTGIWKNGRRVKWIGESYSVDLQH